MTETPPARDGRTRRGWIDALVGGGLALGLITAANAALPRVERLAEVKPAQPHAATPLTKPQAPKAPAPPAAFIAFQDPAPGYPIISPFGLRQLPWEPKGRLHAGVDIAAPKGEPVLAAADGVVTRLASDAGYGRFAEIQHPAGLMTRYGHLARYQPGLAVGQTVHAGQPVGLMGSTGSSTGSHLHFEIRDARDRPLNPVLFLQHSFASAADLPLKAALRWPRGVRTAYVSNIPKARRQEMAERLELAAADSAANAGVDAVTVAPVAGRPHARFKPHS